MLTDEEREILGIDNWIRIHHLYLEISRYASPKELGYKEQIGPKGKIGYDPPKINILFENALSLDKIPKDVKRKIIWALAEIGALNNINSKSKR